MLFWCSTSPLTWGVPAIGCAQEVNNGANDIFRKFALDLPDHLFSLVDIGLSGLGGDKIVDLGIAVMVVVSFGMASVVFAEIDVGIVHPDPRQVHSHRIVAARN